MLAFVGRRVAQVAPITVLVVLITFTLAFYAPGDPIETMYGQGDLVVDEATLQRMRETYGLDRPFPVQLADYSGGLLQGDFGTSLTLRRPVGEVMAHALPISLQLGAVSMALLALLGIPLGVIAALRRNSVVDHGLLAGSIVFAAVPPFVLAPMVMIIVILKLGLISSSVGWNGLLSEKAILPVAILVLGSLPGIVRYTRASVIEVLSQDFVRTARAKGLPHRRVVASHVLRVALTPVLTVFGLSTGGLLTGSVFVESIFGIPGFGSLVIRGIQGYDYPLMLGTTIVGTLIVVLANLAVDLLYGVIDPRVRGDAS